MKSELKDKWVLITGASSGFGAAGARAFGTEGARLLLGARRVARLEEVAADARKAGAAQAHAHLLDVSQTPSVETFFKWVRAKTGRLDVLISNAGGAGLPRPRPRRAGAAAQSWRSANRVRSHS